jgi:mannosyltransferase OCH1-like enzyme
MILRSLSVTSKPWVSILMNFITGLPWLEGHDVISVMVDQLMKIEYFIPYWTITSMPNLVNIFV